MSSCFVFQFKAAKPTTPPVSAVNTSSPPVVRTKPRAPPLPPAKPPTQRLTCNSHLAVWLSLKLSTEKDKDPLSNNRRVREVKIVYDSCFTDSECLWRCVTSGKWFWGINTLSFVLLQFKGPILYTLPDLFSSSRPCTINSKSKTPQKKAYLVLSSQPQAGC